MHMRTLSAAVALAASALCLAAPAGAEVCQDCGGGGGGGTGSTNQPPTAVFSLPAEAFRGQVVDLDGSGSTDPNGNGTIRSFRWDVVGDTAWDLDGARSSVSYPTLGPRTIRLQVTDDKGAASVATKTIQIVNRRPQGQAGCPEFAELGETVTCTPFNPSDADGRIVGYRWDLDGDGFDDGTEAAVSFTPAATGVVRPRLQITDDDGGTTEATTAVTVWKPVAGQPFAMPASAVAGTAVTFTAPLGAGEAEGQWAYERTWTTSGPGTWGAKSADGRVATYTFSAPGTYAVRLRRLRSELPTSSTQETVQTITVTAPPADGGGQQTAHQAPAGSGATPAATAATPAAAAASTARPAAKVTKKKVAARKKSCRTVKAKTGKKARKVCSSTKKKAVRKGKRHGV